MRTRLSFNRARCLGCRNCELACSLKHSRSGTLERAIAEDPAPVRRLAMAAGPEALRCEQCDEPLCVFACKSGALWRDPASGRIRFEESRCVGCYMCLMVCPHGVRPAADRVVRCEVCEDAACAAACPTGALVVVEAPYQPVLSGFRGRVVVVGSSAAGIAACEAAREHAPECEITLVTADRAVYSRPLLAYALAGRVPAVEWRGLDVNLLGGRRAVSLEANAVRLDDGAGVGFDRLVIATGARAVAVPGATCSLRDIEDLETLSHLARPGGAAVVLGGGNVGLQACEALLARGMRVTVAVASSHLLSQMVDAEAGRRVGELFSRHGVTVRTRCETVEEGAGLVVAGKGIQPNIEWLRGSGLHTARGIVVDLCGRTNLPNVFAAGDCAEAPDPLTGRSTVSGIWPVAYEMGRAAGSTAVGIERPAAGALRMNAARFFGTSIVSIGEVRPERLEGAREEVLANREGVYRKLVYCRGRLAGALLYGDISGAGSLYRLYREGGACPA